MTRSSCHYCDGFAELNVGELWLCPPHSRALEEYAGGLGRLLEMPPEARRSLAESVLVRVIREDVREPSEAHDF